MYLVKRNSEKLFFFLFSQRFRQLQLSSDSRVSDTHNEMKLKSFELDRMQLLYEESLKTNKNLSHQNDTLALKMEVICCFNFFFNFSFRPIIYFCTQKRLEV